VTSAVRIVRRSPGGEVEDLDLLGGPLTIARGSERGLGGG
jgi:hypothetical protein